MPKESKRSSVTDSESDPKKLKTSTENYTAATSEDAQNLLDNLKHCDPVLQLHLPLTNMGVPNISLSTPSLLETILHPLKPSSFLSDCFRKKAVHIRSNWKQRADDVSTNIMFGLDPKQIFGETSSDSIFLWIPSTSRSDQNGNVGEVGKCLQSIDIQDANTAQILHENANYASYCRAPPELEQPMVSELLKDLGLGLGQYDPSGEKMTTLGRGEVECFIGTKGHLTDWHTDFQENFTIQLSGRKKWTLKQGTVKHPIRGTTPHYKSSDDVIENQIKAARLSNPDYQFGKQDLKSNAFGKEVEIIVDAGDVLYFPAGMWHKVETQEYGVSINVSLMGSTYASLVCRSLEHLLLEKEEWREVVCSGREPGFNVVEKLKSLMEELPSVVEGFGLRGVAEGMLPPVLREPPTFKSIEDDQESGRSSLDELDGREQDESIENDDENSNSEDKETFNDHDEEDHENVIDLNGFQIPGNIIKPSGKSWRRNPLASLIKMTDVKSFFEGKNLDNESKHQFVLNVNFAGNDMHESAVRVLLKDESGVLDRLCSLRGKGLDDIIEELKDPPSALIYYGYVL